MNKIIPIAPHKAQTLLEEDSTAILIDIRSSMEFLFIGHPVNAVHIAWLDDPDWEINPNFYNEVEYAAKNKSPKHFANIPILLICRSGNRTQQAGQLLLTSGFNNIFDIEGGFEGEKDQNSHRSHINGWRYHDLPWEQC